MTKPLSFHVLGPLTVGSGGRCLDVPGSRQRILLAALLVKFNQVVCVDELVDRIWDSRPPCRPRRALHTCLTRLRHAIADAPGAPDLIRTSSAGYTLQASPETLDFARFIELLEQARAAEAAHDRLRESAALGEALALWRGERALPDVASDSLHRDVVPGMHQQRIEALERRGELELELGHHRELIGELRALTSAHPFHERFWQQLLLALYRCGRKVEALLAYAELTSRIRDGLGVEPGPQLRDLHLAILRDDQVPPLHTAS
ncbi:MULTISPECIES: AfsR/SARP family transcriptional regulator [unclassified Saccharopolyspora]|uniref:AfsR/SARP family transcriptional regulator n=1 Tax=unclassified Saccharopolyspora TaxID=2646250 RepID=UPI001CD334B9|nr:MULTISPECIES: AfsR/SARP family transcriptional regulator [unclassified Saccharopolyspora]MCA1185315.1 AfsR/SARP family transcriptional regulator [Saccharopolyspora sp. 6T]MCA1195779.1 AfsR/SARP family transcriptional regulator [Saccharopolyspora sp. 6V]MCA1224656.1 AfsR/SARP family transcriptional regulator [Saccharopolyspora sp. 6M]MCA1279418.1 AfsR/SARP family transcriptional regulator [Saccharopolyspora sp. 7B]